MSTDTNHSRIAVDDLAKQCRAEMIPLTGRFSYFSTVPMAEEDLRQYLHDPIAALPPAVTAALPKMGIVLVPYVEKGNGKHGDTVIFERPPDARSVLVSVIRNAKETTAVLAIKDIDAADYHYQLYNLLAAMLADTWASDSQEQYYRALREELSAEMHGEVDEKSWHLKQALLRRQSNARRETKLFRDYARQSFEDTMTLYLHGTCCDIDVETGPRQMPSRYLRRRLELLMKLYPPPEGYAVLPEQLKSK